MAVQKSKVTRSRRGKRRTHDASLAQRCPLIRQLAKYIAAITLLTMASTKGRKYWISAQSSLEFE